MKLWLSKSSEVPLQEQLTTQIILGIVSADLAPGERLPSTSQLGRLFHIHPNTVSAAYRDLQQRGWLEWRHGSGFYVRQFNSENKVDPGMELDRLVAGFLKAARARGHSLSEIEMRIQRWLSLQHPERIVVIEPDPELRAILVVELSNHIALPIEGIAPSDSEGTNKVVGSFYVALYDNASQVRADLFLHSRSVPKSVSGQINPPKEKLIQVVSRWHDFLQWSRTTLIAMGIDPTGVSVHDARRKNWQRGLSPHDFIITDSVMAQQFPINWPLHVFQIVADESIDELKSAVG